MNDATIANQVLTNYFESDKDLKILFNSHVQFDLVKLKIEITMRDDNCENR